MSTAPRPAQDLVEATEHLLYEMKMLVGTANEIPGAANQPVAKYAFIESFALHARALLEFFYDSPQDDDVAAEHFVSDWPTTRPALKPVLRDVWTKVGKQIAHLTYKRLSIHQQAKDWAFVQIAQEITDVFRVFTSRVSQAHGQSRLLQFLNSSSAKELSATAPGIAQSTANTSSAFDNPLKRPFPPPVEG